MASSTAFKNGCQMQILPLMNWIIKLLLNISSFIKSDIVHNDCVVHVINNNGEFILKLKKFLWIIWILCCKMPICVKAIITEIFHCMNLIERRLLFCQLHMLQQQCRHECRLNPSFIKEDHLFTASPDRLPYIFIMLFNNEWCFTSD